MSIKVKEYDSFGDFEMDESRQDYEVLAIVHSEYKEHERVCADLMTCCNRWKTAVNRFFRALDGDYRFAGWEDCIIESIENGVWKDSERVVNPNTGRSEYTGGWFYEVEDHDGAFYIALAVEI